MAYRKLTQEVIDTITSELRIGMQASSALRSTVFPSRVFSVRKICEKAGISHTTFYRWMREYRSIKQHKGRLTDSEKQVLSFGCAVEAVETEIHLFEKYWFAEELAALLLGESEEKLEASLIEETTPESEEIDSTAKKRGKTDVSSWEALTDQLTGGIRCVEFDVSNFTKKHVN